TFYWPAASDQGANQSGIAYYEYKTGATEGAFSDWTQSNQRGEELVTIASDITAYQEGQNFFFVRTVDNAGNVSATTSNIGISPFYYNASAPTAPQNVVISPETTSDSPAAENIFSVTWDKPASYSGELSKYYYCVNCTPSADTMTETTSGETADRELTTVALATQQGKNTFYLVAEDNNVNTETGHGNRNFEAYASADFYATTIAPGAPTNLTISDASDRDAEIWRLTLAWKQAASGGTPAHYTIYRSTEGGAYTNIGETTSTAYTDADLTQSQDYSYKVLAIDNAGSSSIASNIVTLAPEGKYTTPPLNSGSPGVTAGSTTAVITWSTGRLAYGAVEYGKTTSYESSVAETVGVTSHSIKLTGLTPGTEYHYRVQALDDSVLMGYDRENAYSSDYTFTTSATPTISDVTASDLTLSSVVVNWSAVSLASASIEYGESTAYGSTVAVGVGTSGTYSTKLTNLTDSTSYHFRIRATDIDGTDITSDDYSFTTLTFPKVTAVVFKTDQAQNGTAISLAWSTNVPTTSELEYQPVQVDPKYKATAESNYDNSSVLRSLTPAQLNQLPVVPVGEVEHSDRASYESRHLSRITSLTDGSLYIFTIRGRDQYGNEFVSEPIRYVTGADTKPPTVSNLVIETPIVGEGVESKAEIVISFSTDEPAVSQVVWGSGTGSEYPEATQTSKDLTTEHIIVLRDLKPTSSYHLKIKTTDESGNQSETEDTIVVTPTAQQAAFELIIKNLEGVFGFLGIN
ncbi:fibronectin type III domain-containing protein, partial [Candidatus Woesebacteria bacterium]|nr:fibronectin type III domain-containing protein [Candidatus Woesebacteria bacterium]